MTARNLERLCQESGRDVHNLCPETRQTRYDQILPERWGSGLKRLKLAHSFGTCSCSWLMLYISFCVLLCFTLQINGHLHRPWERIYHWNYTCIQSLFPCMLLLIPTYFLNAFFCRSISWGQIHVVGEAAVSWHHKCFGNWNCARLHERYSHRVVLNKGGFAVKK